MPIAESDWQQLVTVQGPTSPKAATVASAATIAPTTFLHSLTGNTCGSVHYSACSFWTYACNSVCGNCGQ